MDSLPSSSEVFANDLFLKIFTNRKPKTPTIIDTNTANHKLPENGKIGIRYPGSNLVKILE